jgi:hypothetical protein
MENWHTWFQSLEHLLFWKGLWEWCERSHGPWVTGSWSIAEFSHSPSFSNFPSCHGKEGKEDDGAVCLDRGLLCQPLPFNQPAHKKQQEFLSNSDCDSTSDTSIFLSASAMTRKEASQLASDACCCIVHHWLLDDVGCWPTMVCWHHQNCQFFHVCCETRKGSFELIWVGWRAKNLLLCGTMIWAPLFWGSFREPKSFLGLHPNIPAWSAVLCTFQIF